ncbi:LacI family DNA-binding transcriptional regulator [Streptacidiphilus carbonis]|uniref:LacI family DNA-binding transcriptional regulator n=1 Tax=Streptacidiphilus carbonis TaxID=105422 RepID=UPI001F19EB29|nr:LacI family DNA-binding transcriptional regulator [Streptacidiphilus carbonis]
MASSERVTSIWDIARITGVSHQTVSRVINGKTNVKASTRELVLRTIEEHGYTPSTVARALAGGTARTLTVLTVNTELYGCAATLRGIEEAARLAGFTVAISVLEPGAARTARDVEARLGNPRTPAIVIAFESAGVRALSALNALSDDSPVVGVVERPDSQAAAMAADPTRVWIDDRSAAAHATGQLLGLGHETVHYLAPPSSTAQLGQRGLGWQETLVAAGRRVPDPVDCEWTPRAGYLAGRELLVDPAVTAVLCGNDDLALGVLHAARERGRAVPDTLSVVGFDDAPHSAYAAPTLTTVRMDFEGLGRAAFARLHSLLEPEAPALPTLWEEPELIVRESAGPLRRTV